MNRSPRREPLLNDQYLDVESINMQRIPNAFAVNGGSLNAEIAEVTAGRNAKNRCI